ncbi:MAG: hypothetical protein LBC75_06225 [Fibromonadaceae bacterium]|nr:hypothetical protein [Fibromonadaceae bacterium]
MKTLNSKAICLILAFATQVFAQRFTTTEPEVFRTPSKTENYPQYKQIAALGEKNSAYANIMLVGGRDNEKVGTYNVVKSDSSVLGTVLPFIAPNVFTSNNDTIHDNSVAAVAVLDSFSDNKKTATVIFASLRKLVIMQISISNTNSISSSILSNTNMPESMWEINGTYDINKKHTRRLALLGTSLNGANKVYHLATGNPLSKNGKGRVDFFNIEENSWALLQPNQNGLTSGTNGLVFNDSVYFGKELAVIDNFDKKGGKALVVLLPDSKQFPKSALYLFQMDNDWTPSTKLPVVIAGLSKPWFEEPDKEQSCGGLGIANWEDETPHLLVSCVNISPLAANGGTVSYILTIKDIVLDSTGNILNNSVFSSKKISMSYSSPGNYSIYSNPISIKNHKNDLHSISLIAASHINSDHYYSMATFTVIDADYSKNFTVEAGIQEAIINIDSLFYKSGTSGFSAKTLFGLAQCSINNSNKELLCLGNEKSIGSWSGIELSSSGNCNLYKACKKKDTIFVYVRSASESSNTALRIPKNILIPYYGQVNLGDVKPLSYFKNPNLQNTNISWNTASLKLSVLANTPENGIAITPFSKNEGIDTLVFDLSFPLSVSKYPIYLHIADTSKILGSAIPANPGNDTIWNTVEKKYIALPHRSSKGDIYTYDIAQDSLGAYSEIIGDYLHISRVDIMDISIAYTENGQIKHRKITLMPEPKELPNKIAKSQALSLNAAYIKGGLQINGLNGDFELRAYNIKGREIQREKAYAKGSVFVKLRQNCPQIVQIRSNNEKISIFTPQQQPEW